MKKMKKEMKTRAEEGDDDESGEGGRGKEREKERKRGNGKDENTDMVTQNFCSCANHSGDHNRLPVPRQACKKNLFDG